MKNVVRGRGKGDKGKREKWSGVGVQKEVPIDMLLGLVVEWVWALRWPLLQVLVRGEGEGWEDVAAREQHGLQKADEKQETKITSNTIQKKTGLHEANRKTLFPGFYRYERARKCFAINCNC